MLAVFEDWAGDGAGNGASVCVCRAAAIQVEDRPGRLHSTINQPTPPGFGTLYAYQNAVAKAAALYDGFDLHAALLDKTVAVALYHTAGKGTRCVGGSADE